MEAILASSSIHRMTGWVANSRIQWRMRTAPICPFLLIIQAKHLSTRTRSSLFTVSLSSPLCCSMLARSSLFVSYLEVERERERERERSGRGANTHERRAHNELAGSFEGSHWIKHTDVLTRLRLGDWHPWKCLLSRAAHQQCTLSCSSKCSLSFCRLL